ncbi:MAG: DNA-directed RNA polymerase subunit alpha [Chloroflexi bacterium]|nr:DNA-directed RNA polymerase subunit alpha [Chloroflexota bacterium]
MTQSQNFEENLYGISPNFDTDGTKKKVPEMTLRIEETTDNYGLFIIEPIESGLANSLANPLRRTLLGSLSGTAINWVKISGIDHEYSTVPHMKEEVIEFLMNVKGVRIKSDQMRPGRLRLEVSGEGEVKAGDIMATSDFEVINPEYHLATLQSESAQLSVEFSVDHGIGYKMAEKGSGMPIGVLPVDAIYTPIRKVNFSIDNIRIGDRSNLERLSFEIWTDRTIDPVTAFKNASNVLMDKFFEFTRLGIDDNPDDNPAAVLGISPEAYNTLVESLDLSARTLNCLKRAGINRVGEVLQLPKGDLLKIRNFGQKSITELFEVLSSRGLLPKENSNLSPDPEDSSSDEEE